MVDRIVEAHNLSPAFKRIVAKPANFLMLVCLSNSCSETVAFECSCSTKQNSGEKIVGTASAAPDKSN